MRVKSNIDIVVVIDRPAKAANDVWVQAVNTCKAGFRDFPPSAACRLFQPEKITNLAVFEKIYLF